MPLTGTPFWALPDVANSVQRSEARALLRRAADTAIRSGNPALLTALEQEGLQAVIILDAAVAGDVHELARQYLQQGVRPSDDTLRLASGPRMRAIVLAHRQPQPLHILYAVMSADVAFLAELLSVYKVTLDVRTLTSFREWLAPRFCSPSLVQTGKRIAETLIRHIPSDALTTMSLASTLT